MATYKELVVEYNMLVDRLVQSSSLPNELVQNIVRFVKCLAKPSTGLVDRQIFSVVLSNYFNIVNQKFVQKIYEQNTKYQPDDSMSVEVFSKIICIFLTDNLDMKIDYVFSVYDTSGDGIVDNYELAENIRHNGKCVTDTDDADKDETFIDLCSMVSDCLGLSNEGVQLESFRTRVKENTLFLSIIGQSLPTKECIERFKQKLVGKNNLQMKDAFKNVRHDLLFELPASKKNDMYRVMLDLP